MKKFVFAAIAAMVMVSVPIAELDGAEFFGRQMVVKEARPPKY